MSSFAYVAFDARGRETKGNLDVADQTEAIRRIKEMGFFPTKVVQRKEETHGKRVLRRKKSAGLSLLNPTIPLPGTGIGAKEICVFTRQMATMLEAGMSILRGLRLLEEQETNVRLKAIISEVAIAIEGGENLSQALAQYPKVFNHLYINMVKAGEIGGVLEVVLKRLAEFMEKAQKIKGKVQSAMFYPAAVITVAVAIMGILLVYVVPKFKEVFEGLLQGKPLPAFTTFVLNISEAVKNNALTVAGGMLGIAIAFKVFISTKLGRRIFDKLRLKAPVIGPVVRKVAISRFARTFGTLVSSGVPILQTLTILKETSGNVIVGDAIAHVHENVKQGESITAPLKASGLFPSMVVGMIDVGEQTGALPEMLMKIADNYDDEVDNAVASMTSLLEPIMIVFLAVIVGSIVVALFLPITCVITEIDSADQGQY